MSESITQDDDLEIVEIPRRDAVWGLSLLGILAAAFIGTIGYRMSGRSTGPTVLPTPQIASTPSEVSAGTLAASPTEVEGEQVTAESLFQSEDVQEDSEVMPATFEAKQ
ncbi:MAG: hypothetical protein RH917_13805 [Lacipirellulaceae bacterium]